METSKRKALGKGLEELFNSEQLDFERFESQIVKETPKEEIVEIKIDELRPNPYQPRKTFDEEKLNELAKSIKEYGVIQPIIVKKSSIKGYEIIAGERRFRASQIAGLKEVPAIVREFTNEEMMEIALLENLQRENLNVIEEALAYKKLLENLKITQEELSTKLGKSRSHITNMLGLLNLPDTIKKMIIEEKLSASHARILSKMENDEEVIALANRIIKENLNVRQLEEISQSETVQKKHKITHIKEKKYEYIEDLLCDKYGTKVKVTNSKIEISFVNDNDLNRILEIMEVKD